MQAFLFKVAQHLHRQYGDTIQDVCLVLPNKRGALFLKQHLAKVYNKTIWLPEIIAAEEFIVALAGVNVADNITLTTELYKAYCTVLEANAEPFERFVKWASIMLHDFNECDRYLVNAKDLFGNLRDVKEIENWSLAENDLSAFQQQYLAFMSRLGTIYEVYVQQLLGQNMVYQGLAYRLAVNKLKDNRFIQQYKKFIFCGFNALNKAEEKIILDLCRDKKAEVLWDADRYYVDNKQQEAGKFLRKHFSHPLFQHDNFIDDELSTSTKTIEIIGVPKNMAQALSASQQLTNLIHKGENPGSMAVVLADESLMFPVLSTIPEEIEDVNVTLEYPFKQTTLYDFIEKLLSLHIHRSASSKRAAFYYKDLIRLLYNPYFRLLLREKNKVQKIIRQLTGNNISYISNSTLKHYFEETYSDIDFLFEGWENTHEAILSIESLVEKLRTVLLHNKITDQRMALETEFLFEFSKLLNRIKSISGSVDFMSDLRSFRILLQQLVATASVPFYGEPLKGLQIMGVLETRTLDFENVILLSVNENVLPSGKSTNSFIPFDLKKFFGLPIYSDKDAVYAYHFYRLLQRAKNITLIYNTEADRFGNGEKSRFITQLINELAETNKNITIKERVLSGSLQHSGANSAIVIPKNEAILSKLYDKAVDPERSGFSPSSLNTFKECSLRFYFQYAAGIKETEEMEENIEANTLGTIIHEVLERLYEPFTGKLISSAEQKKLQASVDFQTREAFHKHFSSSEITSGKNLLAVNVVKLYTEKILAADNQYISDLAAKNQLLTLYGLEKQLSSTLQLNVNGKGINVKISGTCDRIDFSPGVFRIVDYKSSIRSGKDVFEFTGFETLFEKSGYNKMFQLFMYAWLACKNGLSTPEKVSPCIIPFRSDKNQVYHITQNKKQLIFSASLLSEFEQHLSAFIERIMDPAQDFVQTKDIETCQFCAYNTICNR